MSTNQPGLSNTISAAVDVSAYCGIVAGEGGGVRHVAQLMPAGGRHVKDGTGVLARGTEPLDLDLTEWIEDFRMAYSRGESRAHYEAAVAAGQQPPIAEQEATTA